MVFLENYSLSNCYSLLKNHLVFCGIIVFLRVIFLLDCLLAFYQLRRRSCEQHENFPTKGFCQRPDFDLVTLWPIVKSAYKTYEMQFFFIMLYFDWPHCLKSKIALFSKMGYSSQSFFFGETPGQKIGFGVPHMPNLT